MKRLLVICLAIVLVTAGASAMMMPVFAVEEGPSVTLDFTAMPITATVTVEMVGAVDISTNYQIASQESLNMMHTIGGYTPTWVTWKLTAPAGKQFTDADLQIIGRICDFTPNENLFGVFVYDAQPVGGELGGKGAEAVHFENAYDGTMATSGNYSDVHDFDLSAKVAGKTEVYVTVFQMTTGHPAWIGYTNLSITSEVEDIPVPALVISEDGLNLDIDFTVMPITATVTAEMVGAVDISTNYQIASQESLNMMHTIGGYTPTWVTWKLTAPAGKQFTDADLQIIGRICDFTPNENLFGVFVYDAQPVGGELGGKGAEAVHFENAYDGTMATSGNYSDVHDFDLSAKVAGKTEVYVTVFQMTTGHPAWIGYTNLSITSEVEDIPEVTEEPSPTEEPDPTGTVSEPDDESPETGDSFPMMQILLSAGAVAVTILKKRK
mgnify:CR=1 FL=1